MYLTPPIRAYSCDLPTILSICFHFMTYRSTGLLAYASGYLGQF